jgi:gamma-glutamyltranspeptidase
MVYVLDYDLDPLEALRMPRIFPTPSTPRVQLENGFPAETLGQLRMMGVVAPDRSIVFVCGSGPGGSGRGSWSCIGVAGAGMSRHNPK